MYVYAADKTDKGMALAEKWRLTLVQPSCSSSKDKKENGQRRTSILLAPSPSPDKKSPSGASNQEQIQTEENAQKPAETDK